MVKFNVALCSSLLASAGLVAAFPASAHPRATTTLQKRDVLQARGIDPARIDAIRERVKRPKDASESEPERGSKNAAPDSTSQPAPYRAGNPPQRPNQNSNSPQKKPVAPPSQEKLTPKPAPKGLNAAGKKAPPQPVDGQPEQQQRPLIKGSRPSYNAKNSGPVQSGGPAEPAPGVAPQPTKMSGGHGSTSQPNPNTSIQRGGNNSGVGPKDAKLSKASRKGRPKADTGSDDIEGSERVARDAVEGVGMPKDRVSPSKEHKAMKKPTTKSKQGSVGKGGQKMPQALQPQAKAGAIESHNLNPETTGEESIGYDGANDDDYFDWFRNRDQVPTSHVVKAKEGWKNQFRLGDAEGAEGAELEDVN